MKDWLKQRKSSTCDWSQMKVSELCMMSVVLQRLADYQLTANYEEGDDE